MGLLKKFRRADRKKNVSSNVSKGDDDCAVAGEFEVSGKGDKDVCTEQHGLHVVEKAEAFGLEGEEICGASVDYSDGGDDGDVFVEETHQEQCENIQGENTVGVRSDRTFESHDGEDESLDTRSILSDGVSLSDVDGAVVDLGAIAAMELEDASAKTPSEVSRRNLIKRYNDVAVQFMENKDFDQSLEMLEKAESLLDTLDASADTGHGNDAMTLTRSRLRSITFNNFGCLYRRISLPEKALEYLEKALVIEELSNNVNECAATHLNLSASHSVLHNDMQALRHGEKAIILIQGQLWPGSSFQEGLLKTVVLLQNQDKASSAWRAQAMRDAHVLAMAYHNVGTQNERLGRLKEAHVSFSRSCTIGMKILGPGSVTTAALIRGNKLFQQRLRDTQSSGHAIASSSTKPTTSSIPRSKSVSNLKSRQTDTARGSAGMKSIKSTASLTGKNVGKKTKTSRGTLPFKR